MFFSIKRFLSSNYAQYLNKQDRFDLILLAKVFPFKVSSYVLEELIEWENYNEDPIYNLVFPKRDMLTKNHWDLLNDAESLDDERPAIRKIRHSLNPHPDGQKDNIPKIGDRTFGGIQHKYKETVLFFPAQGQTCHSYCTYCFRWAQFVKLDEHKFKTKDKNDLFFYLNNHKEVTDVLFTGGDPMFMPNSKLFEYLDVLLSPELEHIRTIRLGSKALSFYPQRFLGKEGHELLEKLSAIIKAGKHVAFMAHFSHPRELKTEKVMKAVSAIRNAGAEIRSQAPLIRNINDDPLVWQEMFQKQVEMGIIPYYMFVERDTGAHDYFSVPLAKAYHIFTQAYSNISGLAKTVRGPSMSTSLGKIKIDGIVDIGEEKYFVLKFLQARNLQYINKLFFAHYDEEATWFDELELEEDIINSKQFIRDYFAFQKRYAS